jgi:hypothetical protein
MTRAAKAKPKAEVQTLRLLNPLPFYRGEYQIRRPPKVNHCQRSIFFNYLIEIQTRSDPAALQDVRGCCRRSHFASAVGHLDFR